MSEIEHILLSGKSARDDQVRGVSPDEFKSAEASLNFIFPPSYREFVTLGGLGELRIKNRVLSPSEIVKSLRHVVANKLIPFASNGCGDLYCWPRSGELEPTVVVADHDKDEYVFDALSFTEWLARNRF